MNFKRIFVVLIVASLLIGCAYATGVTDFKVDDTFKLVYSGDDYAIYADEHNDTGISIYADIGEDNDTDDDSDDALDDLFRDDGDDYLTADDDLMLDKNSDYTANFTDTEYGMSGLSELVEHDGQKYVVVVWSVNSTEMDFGDVISTMDDFNKANDINPISF